MADARANPIGFVGAVHKIAGDTEGRWRARRADYPVRILPQPEVDRHSLRALLGAIRVGAR